MDKRKYKRCAIILKAGGHELKLNVFESPRGLRYEGNRPDYVIIDCYQELHQHELFRLIQYLETIACAMKSV